MPRTTTMYTPQSNSNRFSVLPIDVAGSYDQPSKIGRLVKKPPSKLEEINPETQPAPENKITYHRSGMKNPTITRLSTQFALGISSVVLLPPGAEATYHANNYFNILQDVLKHILQRPYFYCDSQDEYNVFLFLQRIICTYNRYLLENENKGANFLKKIFLNERFTNLTPFFHSPEIFRPICEESELPMERLHYFNEHIFSLLNQVRDNVDTTNSTTPFFTSPPILALKSIMNCFQQVAADPNLHNMCLNNANFIDHALNAGDHCFPLNNPTDHDTHESMSPIFVLVTILLTLSACSLAYQKIPAVRSVVRSIRTNLADTGNAIINFIRQLSKPAPKPDFM